VGLAEGVGEGGGGRWAGGRAAGGAPLGGAALCVAAWIGWREGRARLAALVAGPALFPGLRKAAIAIGMRMINTRPASA
jgi:hypothetical protein